MRVAREARESLRGVATGAAYAESADMKTANPYDLHDHAGARWLAPFLAIFAITIVMALLMLVYPHILIGG